MHFLKNGLLFILGVFLFSNCTSDASVEVAAKSICECVKPLEEINQKMEILKNEAKIEALTELMGQAGETEAKAIKCAQENMSDKIKKEDLKKALEKSCGMKGRLLNEFVGKL